MLQRFTRQEGGAKEAAQVPRIMLEKHCVHSAYHGLCLRPEQRDLLEEHSRVLDRLLSDAAMPIPSHTRDELCLRS